MAAWSDDLAWAPERYDREEAADFEQGFYENWGGPTRDAMARVTDAALAAVDSVIQLLPSVGGDPLAAAAPLPTTGAASPSEQPSPPAPLKDSRPVRARRRGFA